METVEGVFCFVPVRLSSERLPGKCLLDLHGHPVLHHLIERVRACRYIEGSEQIVICTTTASADDPLEAFAAARGVRCFRGDENDIVRRFRDAADWVGAEVILEIDGDDPLCAPESMDSVLDHLLANDDLEFVGARGLPLGLAPRCFTRDALRRVMERRVPGDQDTGYELLFTESGWVKCGYVGEGEKYSGSEARFTLDYDEDFAFLEAVLTELYVPGEVFGVRRIEALLAVKPELIEINSGVAETYWARWNERASGVLE